MRTQFIAKDGTVFVVREIEKTDAKLVFDYFEKLRKERNPGLPRRKKNTLKGIKEWVNNQVEDAKKRKGISLVVEKNRKMCGTCESSYAYKDLNSRHLFYYSTSIANEYRGMGLGTFMFKEQVKLIKKRMPNVKIIELNVTDNNMRAFKLYKRWGFKKVAVVPKRARIGNKYIDDIIMHYHL